MADELDFRAELQSFCDRWSEAVASRSPLVGGRLFWKAINFQVTGGAGLSARFTPSGAELHDRPDPSASTTLEMDENDWRNVLAGYYNVWSVQLAGRQRPVAEDDALLRQVGLIIQSFALRKS